MLYVTTRNKTKTCTSLQALSEISGSDGGHFIPHELHAFSETEIKNLGKKSFAEACAEIVNLLFDTNLDSWAISFAIGRYPVKLIPVGNRTVVAETWHNPGWRFERLARGIEKAIRQSDQICPVPTDWLMIGSRIAVLFGIFSDLIRSGAVSTDTPMDLVVPSFDFSSVMACWYARKLGLPIHNVLCCCNENAGIWNLIHRGEVRTDTAVTKTDTPLCDRPAPAGLERLIAETLGSVRAVDFFRCREKGETFYLEPHELQQLRSGLFATVVSAGQMENSISALYGSNGYIPDPYTALCVAGIGTYRSKTGESRSALVLSEESPRHHMPLLARSLGTTAEVLKKAID